MSRLHLGALAALLVVASAARAAPPAAPPVEAYGRLPAISQVSLSPSGQFMVSMSDVEGKAYILVRTLAGETRLALPAEKVKVRDITWVNDDHVLVQVTATDRSLVDFGRAEYSSTLNIDIPTRGGSILFANDPRFIAIGYGVIASYVIGDKPYAFAYQVPKEAAQIGTRLQGRSNGEFTRWWPDLWRIDLTTNAIERAAPGTQKSDTWAVTPDGAIAGYSNFDEETSTWTLLRGTRVLMQRKTPRLQTELQGIGRTADSLLVFDQSGDHDQWVEINAAGAAQTLWAGENVTGVLRDPKSGLVIGAVVDAARYELFDPTLQAKVSAATRPFHGMVRLASASADFSKFIVHTSGPGDSGTYYLVDLATKRADIIANDYPDVPADAVGEVKLVDYKAGDGLALQGVLTLPPGRAAKGLPVVMLPHGGPIGVHDDPEFNWMAQAFAARGYAVFQPNYRGSDGQGSSFQNAGFGEYGRKMLSDISDGLAELARQGIVDPKRACIVGFSYGGYAALAGVTVQQGLYRCAVSGSGVADVGQMLKWLQGRTADSAASDRYMHEELGLGRPGAPSVDSISPAKLASRADAPILLIHGSDDSVVPITQSQEMERALKAAGKPVEFQTINGEDHWLSKSATRVDTLKAAVAFVEKNNPPD